MRRGEGVRVRLVNSVLVCSPWALFWVRSFCYSELLPSPNHLSVKKSGYWEGREQSAAFTRQNSGMPLDRRAHSGLVPFC